MRTVLGTRTVVVRVVVVVVVACLEDVSISDIYAARKKNDNRKEEIEIEAHTVPVMVVRDVSVS